MTSSGPLCANCDHPWSEHFDQPFTDIDETWKVLGPKAAGCYCEGVLGDGLDECFCRCEDFAPLDPVLGTASD